MVTLKKETITKNMTKLIKVKMKNNENTILIKVIIVFKNNNQYVKNVPTHSLQSKPHVYRFKYETQTIIKYPFVVIKIICYFKCAWNLRFII